jgi:hypothetical protein
LQSGGQRARQATRCEDSGQTFAVKRRQRSVNASGDTPSPSLTIRGAAVVQHSGCIKICQTHMSCAPPCRRVGGVGDALCKSYCCLGDANTAAEIRKCGANVAGATVWSDAASWKSWIDCDDRKITAKGNAESVDSEDGSGRTSSEAEIAER